jgi:hypothetical protein
MRRHRCQTAPLDHGKDRQRSTCHATIGGKPHMLDDIIRFLEEHDSSVYASHLRELRHELHAPREIVLHREDLEALASGRGSVTRDGVAVYYD